MFAFMKGLKETASLVGPLADNMHKEMLADLCRAACCFAVLKQAAVPITARQHLSEPLRQQIQREGGPWDIPGNMHIRGAAHPPLHP